MDKQMTSQKRAIGLVAVVLFVGSMMAHGADFDFASGVKAYDRGDYATALRIFRQLADQGAAEAQSYLGLIYDKGQGVGQDYKEAVKWWRKVVPQGCRSGLRQGSVRPRAYVPQWPRCTAGLCSGAYVVQPRRSAG